MYVISTCSHTTEIDTQVTSLAHPFIFTYIHIYVNKYKHTHTHTYIYIYIHTHTHIYITHRTMLRPPSRVALRHLNAAAAATAAAVERPPGGHGPALLLPPLRRRCRVVSGGSRAIHGTPAAPATVSPAHGQGPPPAPPQPASDGGDDGDGDGSARLDRRRRRAELLRRAHDLRAAERSSSSSSASSASSAAAAAAATAAATGAVEAGAEAGAEAGRNDPGGGGGGGGGTKTAKRSPLVRKRFWRDVHVREHRPGEDGDGDRGGGGGASWEVYLDARPLRHPVTKRVVRVPRSKPLLAAALALEWDLLVSVHHATRQHLIPLTGLVCRAIDIQEDDDAWYGGGGGVGVGSKGAGAGEGGKKREARETGEREEGDVSESIRAGVVRTVMRYLDTDSLLCWAPPPRAGFDDPARPDDDGAADDPGDPRSLSLRDTQRRAAAGVVAFLASRVWPGVAIEPVLDGESIVPRRQPPGTRQVVEGWVAGLDPWELAGLERAVLAGKSLLGAARLLVEWSEGCVGVDDDAAGPDGGASGSGVADGGEEEEEEEEEGGEGGGHGQGGKKFGVEEAARLASIEVDWQTRRWGEVEDTHDVEKVDLRRQLGSVVLLVSGTGAR